MPYPLLESTPDVSELSLNLAVLLFDRYTGLARLFGRPDVRLAGHRYVPYQKSPESTYLFFGVPPGSYTVRVQPSESEPYYIGVDIPVTLPMPDPRWPAYPDATLADESKPLSDPAQRAAYRAQRDLAGLRPSISYPFPPGATLIRGTVLSGGAALSGARVQVVGGNQDYLTGSDGQFVLPLVKPPSKATIKVRASHAIHPDIDLNVPVGRGTTSAVNIDMGP